MPEAIGVEHLEKRFGEFIAVNKINFAVHKGEIFGFLGPNGSGKSTTIRMLCGIITPTAGSGQVAGHDITTDMEGVKKSIGYMSQRFSLYEDLTPFENMRFYLGIYNGGAGTLAGADGVGFYDDQAGGGPRSFNTRIAARLAAASGSGLRLAASPGNTLCG